MKIISVLHTASPRRQPCPLPLHTSEKPGPQNLKSGDFHLMVKGVYHAEAEEVNMVLQKMSSIKGIDMPSSTELPGYHRLLSPTSLIFPS